MRGTTRDPAERDRQVAEQAWDEGYAAGEQDGAAMASWRRGERAFPTSSANPYRADSAAPDEREALLAQAWEAAQRRYPGESGLTDASRGAFVIGWSSALDAALAARPAPTVSGEALERVRTAIAADEAEWRREWRAWCRKSERDPGAAGPSPERMTNLRRARVALAALGLTVADEGRVDA